MSVEVKAIIARVKKCIYSRGARGPTGIHKLFKQYDQDGSGGLDYEEFQQAMKELELALSNQDIRTLFRYFDDDGNKVIDYSEFVGALCGDLTAARELTCRTIFEHIDVDGDGIVSIQDIGGKINPKGHPMVAAGKMLPMEFMAELIMSFDESGCAPEGEITAESFCQYYRLASSFMDDKFFHEMMSNMWHLPESSNNRSAIRSRVDKRPKTLGVVVKKTAPGASAQVPVEKVLARLKDQLSKRGARGIIGLGRKFRIMDDDGSKSLDMEEFKKGMKECDLALTRQEVIALFNFFDKDRDGAIRYEEFIGGLRGQMNERRKSLVLQAFDILDRDGNGYVDPLDVVGVYNAKKHPDVISHKKTEQEVMLEFLDTFDVGGEKDGKVTASEFQNYYSNLSSSIDDDDYFELMIRNAWHISGGEGWCANSANRRVLVTHSDGTQSVEEIQHDLGIKADDKDAMVASLRAQGLDPADISTFDGAGDKDKDPVHGVRSSFKRRNRAKRSNFEQSRSSAPRGVLPGTGGGASSD